ncbi:O-antigen ligase family protein [Mycolicibacterium baixiangningiae]|uniref:O-antigen ligase family protein n=1 Tax=Mycolicibacterium baixiangningiae TaxID=2761578 RepID=UPI0018D16983|nr:O-antigen ligase family protein [Mycolicibacterium baixiangningiae]
MLDLATLGFVGLGVIVFCTLCATLIPRPTLLVGLILLRVGANLGTSSAGGELLPSSAIAGLVAVVAIIAAIVPARGVLSARLTTGSLLVVAAVGMWSLVTVYHFGPKFDYANEFVRVASLVAMMVLAYRIGQEPGADLPKCINWLVGLPAILTIAGYAVAWEPALNTTGRATGTFSHANQAAAYFAVGVVLCIWAYGQSRKRQSLVVALCGLVALLVTQSLGALAAVAVGASVLYALNSIITPFRRFLLIFGGLCVALALFLTIGASGRLAEFEGADYGDRESDNSLDWRFANWQALVAIWWARSPVFGLGFGSTSDEVQPFGTAAHSIAVQQLVETGIAGVIVAAVLVTMLLSAIHSRSRDFPATAAALAAVCAVVVTHGLAGNWLGYTAGQYLALFGVGAMLGRTAPNLGRDLRHHFRAQEQSTRMETR